jgi:hypothetical protein
MSKERIQMTEPLKNEPGNRDGGAPSTNRLPQLSHQRMKFFAACAPSAGQNLHAWRAGGAARRDPTHPLRS